MEYINLQVLKNKIDNLKQYVASIEQMKDERGYYNLQAVYLVSDILHIVSNISGTGTSQSKGGCWELVAGGLRTRSFRCSQCGYIRELYLGKCPPTFCEGCGEKMDGGDDTYESK